MKIICPECGVIPHAVVDASAILERQFEGLHLNVKVVNGVLIASPQNEKDAKYFENFNTAKFFPMAAEMVKEGEGTCPQCEYEGVEVDDEKPGKKKPAKQEAPKQTPVPIPKASIQDVAAIFDRSAKERR